jgi:hypothetical protein
LSFNLDQNAMKIPLQVIQWIPRVLCVIAILFISLFAFDSFSSDRTFLQNLPGFLIHLIPSLVLTLLLILAWKRELIGGIVFTIVGLVATPFIYNINFHHNQSVGISLSIIFAVTLPFILIGILFIVSHYIRKKQKSS